LCRGDRLGRLLAILLLGHGEIGLDKIGKHAQKGGACGAAEHVILIPGRGARCMFSHVVYDLGREKAAELVLCHKPLIPREQLCLLLALFSALAAYTPVGRKVQEG